MVKKATTKTAIASASYSTQGMLVGQLHQDSNEAQKKPLQII